MIEDVGVRHADRAPDIGQRYGRRAAFEQQLARGGQRFVADLLAHPLAPANPLGLAVAHIAFTPGRSNRPQCPSGPTAKRPRVTTYLCGDTRRCTVTAKITFTSKEK